VPCSPTGNSASGHSYGQILKSSSIIGGASGINYLIGMVRIKLVAVLLGPSGIGLVGLYVTATGLVGAFSNLGISSSGVREVAEADASGDKERVARTVHTLRRACWVTGLLGWLLTLALAYPLSVWTFGSGERATAIAILGSTLLVSAISGGQTALLQGTRRIGDLARLNVISVIASTIVAVSLYAWLGEHGIVPVLIASALVNLGFSWWFARRVQTAAFDQGWRETWQHSKRFLGLGLSFMWSGILGAVVALMTRSWIVKELGLDANGIYQAAWGISGMFAGFILGAMGSDFFPRLTAVADDNTQVNRLVNEQTEIGVILALPGLLGTLAFAPWIMHVFYSAKFLPGAELLPWFILGIFGRVVSWPMGFILAAKGEYRWFVATETAFSVGLLLLTPLFLQWLGLWGVALAFAILYACMCAGMVWLTHHLTGFRWSRESIRLLLFATLLIVAGFATQKWLPGPVGIAFGATLTAVASWFSIRGLATRLGCNHRFVQVIQRVPGARFLFGGSIQ
jgi:PST family polysaccharide transporter